MSIEQACLNTALGYGRNLEAENEALRRELGEVNHQKRQLEKKARLVVDVLSADRVDVLRGDEDSEKATEPAEDRNGTPCMAEAPAGRKRHCD